jgi:hypothetical protein
MKKYSMMSSHFLFSTLLILQLMVGSQIVQPQELSAGETTCELARKNVEHKKKELEEYLEAMQKWRNDRDFQLMKVLNYKVSELIEALQESERSMESCHTERKSTIIGLSSVKSEDGKYVTQTCGDLRKALIKLLRQYNSLTKREFSTFSELNVNEKSQLQEARRELEGLEEILKARCSSLPTKVALPFRNERRQQR